MGSERHEVLPHGKPTLSALLTEIEPLLNRQLAHAQLNTAHIHERLFSSRPEHRYCPLHWSGKLRILLLLITDWHS